MSHVDDGTIQAYLDQQLEFAEPEARHAFERHLASHPDDAARVEEARGIREQATGLLRQDDVGSEDIPPFEAVVERANAAASRSAHLKKLRGIRVLALAASVGAVFAVGWYLRPTLLTDQVTPASVVNESAAAPRASDPEAETPADVPQPAGQDRQAVAQPTDDRALGFAEADRGEVADLNANRRVAPTVSTTGARKAVAETEELRQQRTRAANAASGRGVAAAAPPPQRARRVAGEAVALDEVAAERLERQADADSMVRSLVMRDSLRMAARDPRAVFAQGAVDFADWSNSTIADAERLLGSPVLAVEGWTIERVEILDLPGILAVGIVQRMESGVLLGLIQMAAPTTGAGREDAPQTTLAKMLGEYPSVIIGRLWVAGIADLPRDSVESLLADLREAPRTN
ncbi:MAG: hypothetical protein O7I93_08370 [Gemmatimonadetes bacterium]|nr:hypothetical protein [Gemmatimonadota bacterium]